MLQLHMHAYVGTRSVDCLQLYIVTGYSFLGKFDHFAIPVTVAIPVVHTSSTLLDHAVLYNRCSDRRVNN